MKRTKLDDDWDIHAAKRRRLIEITEADCAAATPDNTAFQRAVRRCTKALGVRIDATRVYVATTSRIHLRYFRPRGPLDKPRSIWLEPSPSRAKPKAPQPTPAAQAPKPEAPAPAINPGGLPGAKQTTMPLPGERPGRSFQACAEEVLQKHLGQLNGALEIAFVARLSQSTRRSPTSRQRKLLRELCERCGVPPWQGAPPWVVTRSELPLRMKATTP